MKDKHIIPDLDAIANCFPFGVFFLTIVKRLDVSYAY